jgi:pimeloyl-ACP methyl ester carboxylesterase
MMQVARPMDLSEHHIDVSDGTLFARRWRPDGVSGDDPTIVLFHDSLGCVELWRSFPGELAAATGLPVVAYDRLGFGRSAPHPSRLDRDFMAQEGRHSLPALRTQLMFDRFVAFGHSVGGAMAVECAVSSPGACVAVITEAAQAFVEDRILAGIRDTQRQFADPEQIDRLCRYHGEKSRWVLDSWFETWLAPSFASWTLDDALASLRCPLLAIHGDRDEYGSPAHPARLARLAGGKSATLLIENCGHVPHRERTEEVVQAVARFIRGQGLVQANGEAG